MIGINTYGLGMCLEKDFDGTLQQLKDAGIGAIEPCLLCWSPKTDPELNGGPKLSDLPLRHGFWKLEHAAPVIQRFKDNGFIIRSIQYMGHWDDTEAMEHAIDFAIRQDARYFVHSFNVSTIREIDEWIPYIRDVARRLQEHGISLMMHNHEVEWVPDEGTTVFEHLLKEVPELTVELDVGWTKFAGVNCVETLRKYKNQIRIIHFKDVAEGANTENRNSCFTAMGEGSVPLADIMKVVPELELDEVTEFVLDQDDSHGDMMRDVRVGVANIRKHII